MHHPESETAPSHAPSELRLIQAATAVAAFLTPFMGSAVNVALPAIGKDFGLDALALNWMGTAYLLAAAIFLLPLGKAADLYGRKRIFSLGLVLYLLSTGWCAVSTNGTMLFLGRLLQGISGAMIFATSMAVLVSAYPARERGRALGINTAAVYLGLSLGPFLGGLLTEAWGWQSVFWSTLPLGALSWLLVWHRLPADAGRRVPAGLDPLGSLLYALGLAGMLYGFSRLPELSGILYLTAALVCLAGFVRWEARVDKPLLDLGILRENRVFAMSSLAAFINYSATFALTFLLSLYLQYLKGLSPRQAGLVLVLQPAVMTAASPVAGRLADRFPAQVVASIGMALDVAGLLMLAAIGPETPLAYLLASLFLVGLGFGLFSTPNTHAVMSSVQRRDYGVASATLGTSRLLGQMFSMGLSLLLLSLYVGNVKIQPAVFPEFMASLRMSFLLFAGLCLAGVWASLARGRHL